MGIGPFRMFLLILAWFWGVGVRGFDLIWRPVRPFKLHSLVAYEALH